MLNRVAGVFAAHGGRSPCTGDWSTKPVPQR